MCSDSLVTWACWASGCRRSTPELVRAMDRQIRHKVMIGSNGLDLNDALRNWTSSRCGMPARSASSGRTPSSSSAC